MPTSSQIRFMLAQALQDCRQQTLELVSGIHSDIFSRQSHADFSPVGWHLGHIAYTESLWISAHLAGLPCLFPQYEKLFSADGLPKSQRQNLPHLQEILTYMAAVRELTLQHLKVCDLKNIRLWHWLIQHESQHIEIMTMVLAMHQQQGQKTSLAIPVVQQSAPIKSVSEAVMSDMVLIGAGEFSQGCNAPEAIDNERPVHTVLLDRYWIDRTPVNCGQYRQFIVSGGYQTAKYWSQQGWQWQQQAQVNAPLYWQEETAFDEYPVCGVSWYEADAYARFVGKRLPSESEWERAAIAQTGCEQMMGGVWEWTNSWFTGYDGFQPFPYEGYSQLYFDGEHRVLRGGSWATPACILRRSFRNWYHPHRRELFAGFRCAA